VIDNRILDPLTAQPIFFDPTIFHPYAKTNANTRAEDFAHHEARKHDKYVTRDVHGALKYGFDLHALAFCTTGGLGPEGERELCKLQRRAPHAPLGHLIPRLAARVVRWASRLVLEAAGVPAHHASGSYVPAEAGIG